MSTTYEYGLTYLGHDNWLYVLESSKRFYLMIYVINRLLCTVLQ